MAAFSDRLVYAQFNASGVVGFNRRADIEGFGHPTDMAAKRDGRFMLVGVAEGLTGHGLQVAYITPDGELSNIIQTDDANPTTLDLYTRRTEDPSRIRRALDDDDPDDGASGALVPA